MKRDAEGGVCLGENGGVRFRLEGCWKHWRVRFLQYEVSRVFYEFSAFAVHVVFTEFLGREDWATEFSL